MINIVCLDEGPERGARTTHCEASLALTSITGLMLQGEIAVKQLDLADLQSIRTFTKDYLAHEKGPDLLVLNAGVMACPESYTKDGFEMQIGAFFPEECMAAV